MKHSTNTIKAPALILLTLIFASACQKNIKSPNHSESVTTEKQKDKSGNKDTNSGGDKDKNADPNSSEKDDKSLCDFDTSLLKDYKTDDLDLSNVISLQDTWVELNTLNSTLKISTEKKKLSLSFSNSKSTENTAEKNQNITINLSEIVSLKQKDISEDCIQPAYLFGSLNMDSNPASLEWFSHFSTDKTETSEHIKITQASQNQEVTRIFVREKSLHHFGVGNRFPITYNKMDKRDAYNYIRETMHFYDGNAVLGCAKETIECYQKSLSTKVTSNEKDLLKARMITYENGGNSYAAIYLTDASGTEVLNLKGLLKLDQVGNKKRFSLYMKPLDENKKPIGSDGYGNYREDLHSVNLLIQNENINDEMNIEGDILIKNQKNLDASTYDTYFLRLKAPARVEKQQLKLKLKHF